MCSYVIPHSHSFIGLNRSFFPRSLAETSATPKTTFNSPIPFTMFSEATPRRRGFHTGFTRRRNTPHRNWPLTKRQDFCCSSLSTLIYSRTLMAASAQGRRPVCSMPMEEGESIACS